MTSQNIDMLLSELRAGAALAAGKQPAKATDTPQVAFSDVLKTTLDQVNSAQKTSEDLQKRFELGDEGVNLQDVMVAMQKASLSFQTMVQARNKLVSAYQEIMNTQV
ncbi:flagellar hook-basal body complex protein FliE [Crenobacter sp. SG2303]|uniref:Flagellar hook-basal body complex protein FliE n=1 Tax=Crenobacter oryzisoli TaxID=3056844 RepID=A0ABT7XKA7_9NEIS|nr:MULTISPECIES: flagellar hook-basal body complex protein FliE [unclassified Crenobacter]MDN0074180.1 flagellar hook-basal body complex protein FliE [Crenobacter sp. SG2303]MDN0083451.1 flagellar hook-basal body complex protein FliE [Crenobacter sp. SG2305]